MANKIYIYFNLVVDISKKFLIVDLSLFLIEIYLLIFLKTAATLLLYIRKLILDNNVSLTYLPQNKDNFNI